MNYLIKEINKFVSIKVKHCIDFQLPFTLRMYYIIGGVYLILERTQFVNCIGTLGTTYFIFREIMDDIRNSNILYIK